MFSNGTDTPGRESEPPIDYSDLELSNSFVERYGNDLRYVATQDAWFLYKPDEGRWVKDEKLKVWTLAKNFCGAVADQIMDAMEGVSEKGTKASGAELQVKDIKSKTTIAAVVSLSRSHPKIAMLESEFDTDLWLLNTPEDVVDLKTGKLRKARREDYFTKITKVGPKNEPTPVFDQFMLEIMGFHIQPSYCSCTPCADPKNLNLSLEMRCSLHLAEVDALVQYLMRCYGYALTGDVSDHKLFLQIGDGGNGKGLLNDFISQDIFGVYPVGYSCEIPIEALLESHNDRHPTELMDLWHTRLAIARESDEDTRWNEGRVKRLSGGDRIKARRMRQDYVEFPPTHHPFVFGQAKPRLKGSEQAAWKRRLQMTWFQQKFDDEANDEKHIRKADKKLSDKLRKEAAGVLYKLIRACFEWQKSGLTPPETVRAASEHYLASASTILTYIEERLDKDGVSTITVNEVWPDYTSWCEKRREVPCGRQTFNDKLESAGISIMRVSGQRGICKGVKLKGFEV